MLEMVKRGQVTDVKTVIGTFWLEKILDGRWSPG
jgi:ADP-ribose pyrophosphatase